MNVPVLWVHHDPDGMCRGYWDQGLLEAIFARELWTPQNGITFEHREIHGDFPDDVEGAVVVLPSRHHKQHVDWFVEQLDQLAWSVVILAGTEEWSANPGTDESPSFDWTKVTETPTRKVWVMQPIPAHADLSGLIPGGWYPGTHQGVAEGRSEVTERTFDWFFAGQVTHERREQCAEVLRELPGGELIETEGYTQGIPQDDYFRKLASAKVIPCPSGPEHVDTARTFEALEAGSVPVCDLVKPHERHSGHFNYWTLLFGNDFKMPSLYAWDDFPKMLDRALAAWPIWSNRLFSRWQQWKRKIVKQMDNDVRSVSGSGIAPYGSQADPTDIITVVITSSYAPLHPSTEHIKEVIASIRGHLPLAEIVIVCDGLHPDDAEHWADYEEYQRRLFWLCNFEWRNIIPVRMTTWGHQANAVREAIKHVDTPLVMLVEHDTPLKEWHVEWFDVCWSVLNGRANVIRFHHEGSILPDHETTMLPTDEMEHEPVPGLRSIAWWQRPHVSRSDFYRERVLPNFSSESRCFIEDKMYGLILNDYEERGEAAWWDWRIYIYEPEQGTITGSMQRSYHLDSRGDAPKHEQSFG